MLGEKDFMLPPNGVSNTPRQRVHSKVFLLVGVLFFCWTLPLIKWNVFPRIGVYPSSSPSPQDQCSQVEPISPSYTNPKLEKMEEILQSQAFRNASIARLSGAVRIRTESFDDLGAIGKDKRWDVMFDFADYLSKTFPLVHGKLKAETVNTHGLLFTWQGSDPALKPLLLMAHQDVVPVPASTINAWTHPPFSGYYDGTDIWGRGASDDKTQVIAIFEAVELLLEAEFSPKRTVLLAFGFDEEVSGHEGAGHLAPYIQERYGRDSIAAIVDEGTGFQTLWGSKFALPAVGEKGYIDIEIVTRMPGGHSSIPPDRTSIGVLSELITLIEDSKYPPCLDSKNPFLSQLQCGAAHSPDFSSELKKLLLTHGKGSCTEKKDLLALEAAKAGPDIRYLMQTSVAADVISGGVKNNALPERVSVIFNLRISVQDTVADIKSKTADLAGRIAHKYNLTLHAFDGHEEEPKSITLREFGDSLEPAPVSPTEVDRQTPYAVLAGTTRRLYGREVLVSPSIPSGNTDTKFYWNLTQHIFRFGPGWDGKSEGLGNIHTVDERVSVASHVTAVQWFSLFVRNMDEAQLYDVDLK